VEIAKVVLSLDLPPSKLDIGKLTYEYILEKRKYPDARHFVLDKLKEARSSEEITKTWFYMVLVELDVY
jgi:glyceraldehyde 3-phosphate dehydrogenase